MKHTYLLDSRSLEPKRKHMNYHPRSLRMLTDLQAEKRPVLITERAWIDIEDKEYQIISSNTKIFYRQNLVSIGGFINAREWITVTDEDYNILEEKANEFILSHEKLLLSKEASNFEICHFFDELASFIKEDIFLKKTKRDLNAFLKTIASKSSPRKIVPLRSFIKQQVGVCRHFALLTAILTCCLQEKGIIANSYQIRVHRDNLQGEFSILGAHAWNILIKENKQLFHLDSFWQKKEVKTLQKTLSMK